KPALTTPAPVAPALPMSQRPSPAWRSAPSPRAGLNAQASQTGPVASGSCGGPERLPRSGGRGVAVRLTPSRRAGASV
ncbi:MAG: hypothetical protein ACK46L_13335, partial [Synechococcaceae cyanobacterium]